MLAEAIAYAAAKHYRQVDKGGQPFIGHPLRVMAWRAILGDVREHVLTAAVLHDVVEDTDVTVTDVHERFGPDVARIVDALSRRENETYREYIERVALDPEAAAVKLADIADNTDQRRTGFMPELQDRYARARAVLQGVSR